MVKKITLSRQDLYRKIWDSPLSRLRYELGVSDVAIANACRRAKIPMPGKGYWQTAAGSRPRAPELPLGAELPDVVTFTPRTPKDPAEVTVPRAAPEPQITVSRVLRAPHSLLQWVAKGERSRGAGIDLDMTVSKEALERTSLIMDALIKSTEREGWSWRKEVGKATVVTVDGVDMKFVVRELQSETKIKNPPGSWYEYSKPRKWSGVICIYIEEWGTPGVQKRWRDTARHPLETTLRTAVIGIRKVAIGVQQYRQDLDEKRRGWEAEWRQIEEMKRRAHAARQNREALGSMANQWKQAEDLRSFLRSASGRLNQLPKESRPAAMDWLRWAREVAEAKDPLRGDWFRLLGEWNAELGHE